MNISGVGSNPSVYAPSTAQKPAAAATTEVQTQTMAPVDADGDHDGDTAAGDRLDVRG